MAHRRPPEWLRVLEAVDRLAIQAGGEKKAQDLIAAWIVEGKVPTRARAIEKLPSLFEHGGDDSLTKVEAVKRGFAKVDFSGLRSGPLELTERFWAQYAEWETDYAHWDWERGNLVVGYQFHDEADEPSFWLARGVAIKARPLLSQFEIWLAGQDQPSTLLEEELSLPRPVRTKSHKGDPRRDQWTGQVVLMALRRQITPKMTANELILEVERQLISRGIWGSQVESLDRTTVYASAQEVIKAARSMAPEN